MNWPLYLDLAGQRFMRLVLHTAACYSAVLFCRFDQALASAGEATSTSRGQVNQPSQTTTAESKYGRYEKDFNLNRFINFVTLGPQCPKANSNDLREIYAAGKKLLQQYGKSLPEPKWNDPDTEVKSIFFRVAATLAAAESQCRGDRLIEVASNADRYSAVETLAINRIADHLDRLRELDRNIYGLKLNGWDKKALKNTPQYKELKLMQTEYNLIWNSLWMINDPQMAFYVRSVISSGVSRDQFLCSNKSPRANDCAGLDQTRVFAAEATSLKSAGNAVKRMASQRLTYSFRKGPMQAIINSSTSTAVELLKEAQNADYKSSAKAQLVTFSNAIGELQSNGFLKGSRALACRLSNEFIIGAKKADTVINVAAGVAGAVAVVTALVPSATVATAGGAGAAAVGAAEASSTALRIGPSGMKALTVLGMLSEDVISLKFMQDAAQTCERAAPMVQHQCVEDKKGWYNAQLQSLQQNGNCLLNTAATLVAGKGSLTGAAVGVVFKGGKAAVSGTRAAVGAVSKAVGRSAAADAKLAAKAAAETEKAAAKAAKTAAKSKQPGKIKTVTGKTVRSVVTENTRNAGAAAGTFPNSRSNNSTSTDKK